MSRRQGSTSARSPASSLRRWSSCPRRVQSAMPCRMQNTRVVKKLARRLSTRFVVFGVYGISVGPRGLGLIADYMTHEGAYTPLNRAGIESGFAPILKMSFGETTMHFLSHAMLHNDRQVKAECVDQLGRVPNQVAPVALSCTRTSTSTRSTRRGQSRQKVGAVR